MSQYRFCFILAVEMVVVYIYTLWEHQDWSPFICFLNCVSIRLHTVLKLEFTLYIQILTSLYSKMHKSIKDSFINEDKNQENFNYLEQLRSPKQENDTILSRVHFIHVQSEETTKNKFDQTVVSYVVVQKLCRIQEIYNKVYRTTEFLNREYGLRQFLVIVKTVCLLVSCITDLTFSLTRYGLSNIELKILLARVVFLIFTAYDLAILSILIMNAVQMKELITQTPLLLYKVAKIYKHDSAVQHQIELMILNMWTHKIEFTTNGILNLDFKLILMILSAVATYVIILVQLQQHS